MLSSIGLRPAIDYPREPKQCQEQGTETVSGTVSREDFAGTAFLAYRGDESESLDHRHHPLSLAKRLTADHTLPQTLQLLSLFIRIHPAQPVGRSRDGPVTHQGLLMGVSVGRPPQATPPPGFRPLHQSSPEGVALHVPAHRQQMLVGLDHEGFEPPLIQMPCSDRLPMGMPPLRMGERQPAHESRQVTILSRPDDEMPVVRHDTVGQQSHRHAFTGLRQDPFKRAVVAFVVEQALSPIRTVQHVIDEPARCRS